MKSVSFAALAVVVGLWGCSSTPESPDATAANPAEPGKSSSSAQTGAATKGGARQGSAVPPVQAGGSQRPDLKRSVYFEYDKYEVKPEYRALLESHARWLKTNPQARLTIEGNADERGSREYNLALGQRRAESVTKMLVLMGVKPEQIEAVSWGEEKPRTAGHDDKSWSENRRDDFVQR
jgi:peptidoglycan-associated lipoprotein